MRNLYKIFSYTIILCAIFLLAWGTPNLYGKIDVRKTKGFFTYYSSIVKSFAMFTHDEKGNMIRKDREGNRYSQLEFDSILPLFYYRQLKLDNKLPKEVDGHPISVKILEQSASFFRLSSRDINAPKIPLYPLFPTLTGRVGLSTPPDVFRFNEQFQFVDIAPNAVDKEKSEEYYSKLLAKGFTGKAIHIANDPNSRKPYENGSFIVDENFNVFHIKDVAGKAFVKKTTIPSSIKTKHIEVTADGNRKFYGYLFDEAGAMYLIKAPSYELVKLDIPNFDINKQSVKIYGNLLYWNVYITGDGKDDIYALKASDFKQIDKMNNLVEVEESFRLAEWIFPFRVSFTTYTSKFVDLHFKFGKAKSIWVSILLALLFFGLFRKKSNYIDILLVALTGIYGLITLLVLKHKELVK